MSSGTTPHYTAPDQAWTNWAHDNEYKGRISRFAMLLAAFVFLYFIGVIRDVLDRAESQARGFGSLGRVAFVGALVGIVGMTMAFVTLAAASSEGENANPVVSKSVTTGAAGAFLVAAIGFAAFLMSAGVITSLTVLNGTANGSPFGYAFLPAILALVAWTIATSVARYRDVTA